MHTQFKRALAETPRDEWPKLQDEFGDLRVPLKDYEHRRADGTLVKPKDMYSINPWTAAVHSSNKKHCPEMRPRVNKKYRTLALAMTDGTRAQVFVHRLVAFAAFGPRPNGKSVDHINRNTETDNCFTNLRYASPREQSLNRKMRDVSVRVPFNPEQTLPDEEFRKYKPPGAKGHYLISNMRRVVQVSSSKMKTLWLMEFRDPDPKSYPILCGRTVHDIVVALFIRKLKENEVIMHKNNNSHDFTLSNLGIGSRSENTIHAVESNAIRTCPTIMCEYDATTGNPGKHLAKFKTYVEIKASTGVITADKVIAGRTKKAFTKLDGPTWRARQCVTFIVDEEESDRLQEDRAATKQKQLDDHLDFLASRRPVIRKLTIDGVLLNIYESMRDAIASISNKSDCSQIGHCIAGRIKSTHGFLFDAVHVDKLNNVIP